MIRRIPLRIVGLGPHDLIETELVDGVTEFSAPNGAGKTWTLRALANVSGRRLQASSLTIKDDWSGAEAEITYGDCSVTLKPGEAPKKTGGKAPPTGAVPEPIDVLQNAKHIDEGNVEARQRARYEALGKWTGISGTEDQRAQVIGDDSVLQSWAESSVDAAKPVTLIDFAKATRDYCHKKRRYHEQMLAQHEQKRRDVQSRMNEIGNEAGSDLASIVAGITTDEAREMLSAARAEAAAVRARRERYLEERAERERIAAELGEPPNLERARAEAEDLGQAVEDARRVHTEQLKRVEELRRRLTSAEAELAVNHAQVKAAARLSSEAVSRLSEAEAANRSHAATKARLEAPLDGPTEDQVAAAEEQVEDCERDLRLAQIVDRLAVLQDEERTALETIEVEQQAIERWAEEARSVWSRLAAVYNAELSRTGRFRVNADGEIEIKIAAAWRNIDDRERVSEGQLAEACYEEMIDRHERGDVIVVEGTCSVDPDGLERLGGKARGMGVAMAVETTAPAAEGWSVRHYPRGGAA